MLGLLSPCGGSRGANKPVPLPLPLRLVHVSSSLTLFVVSNGFFLEELLNLLSIGVLRRR